MDTTSRPVMFLMDLLAVFTATSAASDHPFPELPTSSMTLATFIFAMGYLSFQRATLAPGNNP
jgi:hypothetical protein